MLTKPRFSGQEGTYDAMISDTLGNDFDKEKKFIKSTTEMKIDTAKQMLPSYERNMHMLHVQHVFASRLGSTLSTGLQNQQSTVSMESAKTWVNVLGFEVKSTSRSMLGSVKTKFLYNQIMQDPNSRRKLVQMRNQLIKFYPREKLKYHFEQLTEDDIDRLIKEYLGKDTQPKVTVKKESILPPLPPLLDQEKRIRRETVGANHIEKVNPQYLKKVLERSMLPYSVPNPNAKAGKGR